MNWSTAVRVHSAQGIFNGSSVSIDLTSRRLARHTHVYDAGVCRHRPDMAQRRAGLCARQQTGHAEKSDRLD